MSDGTQDEHSDSVTLTLSDTYTFTGFEDYGAYWRSNYETIETDPLYKYTGDQLMEDVRSVYKEVRLISIHASGLYVSCFRASTHISLVRVRKYSLLLIV